MSSGWEISGMLGSRSVRVQGVHLSSFPEEFLGAGKMTS
jgi:hypothetical protein